MGGLFLNSLDLQSIQFLVKNLAKKKSECNTPPCHKSITSDSFCVDSSVISFFIAWFLGYCPFLVFKWFVHPSITSQLEKSFFSDEQNEQLPSYSHFISLSGCGTSN